MLKRAFVAIAALLLLAPFWMCAPARAQEEEVDLLIRARPDVYFVTPHYA